MAISAATPMNTPSIVSADLILLRNSAWMAAAMIIRPKDQNELGSLAGTEVGRKGDRRSLAGSVISFRDG